MYTVANRSIRSATSKQMHLLINRVAFHAAQHVVENQHWEQIACSGRIQTFLAVSLGVDEKVSLQVNF